MYKVVLFDLDGTLLDTVPDIQAVLNNTLRKYNLPAISRAQTKEYVGNGAYMLVKRACGDVAGELIKEVYTQYTESFAQCKNELSSYYEGETYALEKLKTAGVKMGIITNKPQRATLNVYGKFFKQFDFFFVQGQEEDVPLKPSPESVYRALELCGEDSKSCLFVGDGETDVLTAKNAGIDCASVLWGYRGRKLLSAVGATVFANDFDELLKIIL